MRKKQIIVAVAVLVVVAVLLVLFGRPRTKSRGVGERTGQLVVPGFKPDDARLIEITKQGADTVRIRKTGDAWTVESSSGYAADDARVEALLDAIAELRVRDVRSNRPASFAQFDVDDAGGIWVHVHDANDTQIAFVCAGKSSAYDAGYVRVSGSNDVVEATPSLERSAGVGAERVPDGVHFVDKTVLTFEPNNVQRVTLGRTDATAVLERTKADETVTDPDTGAETTHTVTKWIIREPAAAGSVETTDEAAETTTETTETAPDTPNTATETTGEGAGAAGETVEDADEAACMRLINDLAHVDAMDIGGPRTVFECGLGRSEIMVRFEFTPESGRAPVSLFIGDKSPDQDTDGYFAMTDQESARIFVIPSYYRDAAATDFNDLRKVKRQPPAEDHPGESDTPADNGSVTSPEGTAPAGNGSAETPETPATGEATKPADESSDQPANTPSGGTDTTTPDTAPDDQTQE